ncbi:hypothetical protein [Erythrobacter sp. THAF29]|uniref:hypothetical protein n=1 Tax=Erythrobacter sp. THAF29 TaxID=2587851 RepID=UPI001268E291|nr:hypothetical protein [Erythrobacter sp. THAF29]QFT77412.1 hypothetical protein FIU90_07655 [Erythrobacter sp. THAF29]
MNERTGDKYAFLQFIKPKESNQPEKARRWSDVLSGILTGELRIGSRRPVQGMPTWATPEVLRGGFATGAYAAGGPLLSHELKLAEKLEIASKDVATVRSALNTWFLSDVGLSDLDQLISEGRYEADTPEEMALVCVALLADPAPETAKSILGEIVPFFDRLRFYPRPRNSPRPEGLHVRSVAEVRQALKRVQPRGDILVQNATLSIWIPLYDRLMDLLDARGPALNVEHAKAWLHDYEVADKSLMAVRWRKPSGRFQRSKKILEALVNGKPLQPRDEAFLDKHLKDYFSKHGRGEVRGSYRRAQKTQIVADLHDALAEITISRIAEHESSDGLVDIDSIVASVTSGEARTGASTGAVMPPSIQRKVGLAQLGSVEALIEKGLIRSPETLGSILPGIAGELYRNQFDNPRYGFAYASAYEAFHRRRSLLLLNLESQVRVDELPWIAALSQFQKNERSEMAPELELLDRLVTLLITHFPHVQFPNPVIEQMQSLGRRAELKIPLVSELAADIFMGQFSQPFGLAGSKTVEHFAGTLYARYYDLPNSLSPKDFARLCHDRAGQKPSQGWSVAYNGMVLEQAMILTSHNMAAVFELLPLRDIDFKRASIASFEWIVSRLQQKAPHHHARLIAIKQSAYAWRQMVAYLSRLSKTEQREVYAAMDANLADGTKEGHENLRPFLAHLGQAIEEDSKSGTDGRYLVGWTLGEHPLMDQ